jgi:hypothetical protein
VTAVGLYNLVLGRVTCPRCGGGVDAEVETRLGYVHEVLTLRVGDPYPWNHPAMPSGRPADGGRPGLIPDGDAPPSPPE